MSGPRREALISAAATVRADQEKEDEIWADMKAGLCSFCQRPVTIDDFLELASIYRGRLYYPRCRDDDGGRGEPIAYLTHKDCSPINGYWLCLNRLSEECLEEHGLLDHIESKIWASWEYSHGLRLAIDIAERLRRSPRRKPSRPTRRVDPSPTLRARVFERDGFLCRRCGHGPPEVKLVLDHIVAVANGGSTTFENLQSLCQPCNAGKSDRPPHSHDLQGVH